MNPANTGPQYYTWGVDQSAYGPVELPDLVNWIRAERVVADSWVYCGEVKSWSKASQIPELKMFFKSRAHVENRKNGNCSAGLTAGTLRRIKIFADMDESHLGTLIKYAEILNVRPFSHVIRRGETGDDALFGVLDGELRSSILIEGKECPLVTLAPGSIFGEISFIDRAPHAADVLSNQESVLVKFSTGTFEKILKEEPQVALAFMLGLTKSLTGRVRRLTRRFEETQLGQFAEVKSAA